MDVMERTTGIGSTLDGLWPSRPRDVLAWLVNGTHGQRFIDNMFVELCNRLVASGLGLGRASLHFRINHPQWLGARILWEKGMSEAEIDTFAYGIESTAGFINSPMKIVYDGAEEFRDRIVPDAAGIFRFPLFADLHKKGLTEYIAWPLYHTLGKRHVATFSSDRLGGFLEEEVEVLRDIVPALALTTEVRIKNALARTLLQTYVGPHASEQILAGATTRGSGATVSAAVMICDLRDFTALSSLWPRDDVIGLLNAYFDALSEPIEEHGGEILKFMGDGLLAIFPLSEPNACANLLAAIREGHAAMQALNDSNRREGQPTLGYGVGVHVGDVMYGNIGSQKRLDFTVIGPAVNVASRLESLTKEVKRPVLLSEAFARMAGCEPTLQRLGSYTLRGLNEPVNVFALELDDLAPEHD